MSSLLCVKSSKGTVNVHDQYGADELLALGPKDIRNMKLKTTFMPHSNRSHVPRNQKVGGSSSASHLMAIHSASSLQSSMDSAVGHKNTWMTPSRMQVEVNKAMESSRSMYNSLLEMEQTFVKEVDQSLQQADFLALRKKELLHKAWSNRVFEPLRRQVLQTINSKQSADRNRHQYELYQQYLEHVNRRGHVFLENLDKGEYYAQALNGHRPGPITVCVPSLQDPLLMQGREKNREEQTILRCSTGEVYSLSDIDQIKLPLMPLVPLGRHGNPCGLWLEMSVGNIVSTPRKASRLRIKGNCTKSQIDFGHWSKEGADQSVVDQELKSQKKRMFINTPPFDRPPRPVNRPPFACCTDSGDARAMCPVSA